MSVTTTERYAEVVLPVPVAAAFTYEIPEDMQGRVAIGRRVEVDFGRRTLSGVVVGLRHDTDVARVKPLRKLYQTYLPETLLQLSNWIAEYYGCSVGEAVQSALPPSLKASQTRAPHRGALKLTVSDESTAEAQQQLKRARKQNELFTAVRDAGGVMSAQRIAELGFGRAIVDGLVAKGFAVVDESVAPSALESVEGTVTQLTDEQSRALEHLEATLSKGAFSPTLLYGVTGSGKTEVYLRAARKVLDQGGGCIVLVPEIGLLPQARARYRKFFGDNVAIMHSRMTGPERYEVWAAAERGDVRLVVGPRSAVFTPIKNLRLVIVDEEQDDSYKQDDKPRYHARNVALMRGKYDNAVVVMGSATPSAETMRWSKDGKYTTAELRHRAQGAPLPDIELVDMRQQDRLQGVFSPHLIGALQKSIDQGEQTILFLNKRGHARYVQCNSCGWVGTCKNCDISLTYHRVGNRLKCHFCGYERRSVTNCDECKSPRLSFAGIGTQRIETELAGLFPGVAVLRMDADTTSGKHGHQRILEQFSTGKYPILLGTQMVTKGHHFPNVSLVGVISAEDSLNYPDFRAAERTFQQLTQVSGRAGRSTQQGRVIIQTFTPDHAVFQHLRRHDYDGFMAQELAARRALRYPPFARIVLASCSARNPNILRMVMTKWAQLMRTGLDATRVQVLGPTPPLIARVNNRFREQILVKGGIKQVDKDQMLAWFRDTTASTPGGAGVELRWDVDPESFL